MHEDFSYCLHINNDVGWVKFDGGLPEGYAPATILKDPSGLPHGHPLTLVGYGCTSDDLSLSPAYGLAWNRYLIAMLMILLGLDPS